MMPKYFIEEWISMIKSHFPMVRVRYEFKDHTQTHVIEIVPLSLFEENEEYLKMESDFEYKFEQLFPKEEILFISENSLTKISALK